jgi:hypothetical protein
MYIASSFNICMGVSYILMASAYEGRTSSEDMVECMKVKMMRIRETGKLALQYSKPVRGSPHMTPDVAGH